MTFSAHLGIIVKTMPPYHDHARAMQNARLERHRYAAGKPNKKKNNKRRFRVGHIVR